MTLPFANKWIFRYHRLEDLPSQEASLEKWNAISEKTSALIEDSRAKLNEIKSKDPRTTPEIKEQLEEVQVSVN